MYIYSENIRQYVIDNVTLKNKLTIDSEDLENIKEITLNKVNLNLEEAVFIPEELKLLINLEKGTFSCFNITTEIIKNLNFLPKLQKLNLNFCKDNVSENEKLKIKDIILSNSDFSFLSKINLFSLKKIILENIDNVDCKMINNFQNLESLTLLNCTVNNFNIIKSMNSLKEIKCIGCKLDDSKIINEIKSNVNIVYDDKKYFKVQ